MGTNWKSDISELIIAVSERQNLIVRNKNLMMGLVVRAVSGGLGMLFGPVGMVAGAAVGGVASVWLNGERPLIEVIKGAYNWHVRATLHWCSSTAGRVGLANPKCPDREGYE